MRERRLLGLSLKELAQGASLPLGTGGDCTSLHTRDSCDMQKRKSSGHRLIMSALVLLPLPGTSFTIANAGQSDVPSRGIAVYVRDFELSVSSAPAADRSNPCSADKQGQQLRLRSSQLQNAFGETLVDTLKKQGYSSSRGQVLSGNGILLKGMFAEADQKNRIRMALLGSGSRATKLTLYVGAFNQKNVSQPLYVEAPVQEPDPNYGPVITLNSYIPMAKYEIEKDLTELTEADVRRICVQLAADLTALLERNPAAVAQAKET